MELRTLNKSGVGSAGSADNAHFEFVGCQPLLPFNHRGMVTKKPFLLHTGFGIIEATAKYSGLQATQLLVSLPFKAAQ
jgi:hypothetical protein